MAELPEGTVTFLFTDIEGSTRLWEDHPNAMRAAVARHDALLREVMETGSGYVFKTMGDAFCVAFDTAPEALDAALAAHRALVGEPWGTPTPLRVRMALHTGSAELRDRDYFGQPLNRVARLLAAGHGGQVLLSEVTRSLTRDTLPGGAEFLDLGEHYLRDLGQPERIFQLCCEDLPADFPPLRSLRSPSLPNNLPPQRTSFIGREKELREITALLQASRLLTLTGSGGCGKTRLALQVSVDTLPSYRDGAWLVELAPLSDPDLVTPATAGVFGLKETPGEPILATLTAALQSRQVLLILDNCEHVLDTSAHLADTLLRACPNLTILASSREGLGVPGEQTYRIPSLSLPDTREAQTPETVAGYESVRLFTERALLARSDFAITTVNAPALAQLCRRLDGIPLAIELAAARTKSLSVEEISQRLDQRFRLLTGGSRTALPRQQTLRSLIDWSYNLLKPEEKTLLLRLSVFQGGWTLAAAESVCAEGEIEEWEVLDLLTDLVDKSLVLADQADGQTRYRLLETVRQYARDRSLEGDMEAAEATRGRHLACYTALAEETEPRIHGPEQAACLHLLDTEMDNLRAALRYAIDAGRAGGALRLSGALREFWWLRGHLHEGLGWYTEALSLPGTESVEARASRASALFGLGYMAMMLSDFTASHDAYTKSLALYREQANRAGAAHVLLRKGYLALELGEYEAARNHFEQCLTLYRELGVGYGILRALYGLSRILENDGDFEKSQSLLEQGLSIARTIGDKTGIAGGIGNLATLAVRRSDFEEAHIRAAEGVALARESGNRYFLAGFLGTLAWSALELKDFTASRHHFQEAIHLYQQLGNGKPLIYSLRYFAFLLTDSSPTQAARLLGASSMLSEPFGSTVYLSGEQSPYSDYPAKMRTKLGDAAYRAALAEGATWTLEQAAAAALETGETP